MRASLFMLLLLDGKRISTHPPFLFFNKKYPYDKKKSYCLVRFHMTLLSYFVRLLLQFTGPAKKKASTLLTKAEQLTIFNQIQRQVVPNIS